MAREPFNNGSSFYENEEDVSANFMETMVRCSCRCDLGQ